MYKYLIHCLRISLYAFFVGIFSASAQTPDSSSANSLLWEVSGNGLKTPSYLFGTIHLICPKDLVLSDSLLVTFSKSKQLYLEVDIDDPNEMSKIEHLFHMPDGQELIHLVDAQQYQKIDQILRDSVGIDVWKVRKIKPHFIVSLLYKYFFECKPASYEDKLIELAKLESKEIHGLETLESQIAAFDAVPLSTQVQELTKIINDMPSAKSELKEIVRVYKSADVHQLHQISQKSLQGISIKNDQILDQRNRNWISPMKQQMKLQSTFFAFGAAHLGGDQGIIQLLQKEGFQVRPIR